MTQHGPTTRIRSDHDPRPARTWITAARNLVESRVDSLVRQLKSSGTVYDVRERVATTTRAYLGCLRIPRATLPAGREVGWAERLTATPIRGITSYVMPQTYGSPSERSYS